MRKFIIFISILLTFFLILYSNTPTKKTASELIRMNTEIDIFQFNNIIYANATDIDWVQKLDLTLGQEIGSITKTRKKGLLFTNGAATKLPINAVIYKSEENDSILLVEVNDKIIRYLAMIEG